MPFGLRGKVLDEEGDDTRTHYRYNYDKRSPRAGNRVDIGVIADGDPTQKQEVMEESNQPAKYYCSQPCNRPDYSGQQAKTELVERTSRHI